MIQNDPPTSSVSKDVFDYELDDAEFENIIIRNRIEMNGGLGDQNSLNETIIEISHDFSIDRSFEGQSGIINDTLQNTSNRFDILRNSMNNEVTYYGKAVWKNCNSLLSSTSWVLHDRNSVLVCIALVGMYLVLLLLSYIYGIRKNANVKVPVISKQESFKRNSSFSVKRDSSVKFSFDGGNDAVAEVSTTEVHIGEFSSALALGIPVIKWKNGQSYARILRLRAKGNLSLEKSNRLNFSSSRAWKVDDMIRIFLSDDRVFIELRQNKVYQLSFPETRVDYAVIGLLSLRDSVAKSPEPDIHVSPYSSRYYRGPTRDGSKRVTI